MLLLPEQHVRRTNEKAAYVDVLKQVEVLQREVGVAQHRLKQREVGKQRGVGVAQHRQKQRVLGMARRQCIGIN